MNYAMCSVIYINDLCDLKRKWDEGMDYIDDLCDSKHKLDEGMNFIDD